jgi:POT family proton-dependent oligopeptide transporter
MSESIARPDATGAARETTFGGHPRGLQTLFFTELWERFSYYGMRSLLVLYLTAAVGRGGLAMKVEDATAIYGWYTSLVYFTCLPGGFLADRWLGQRRSVLLGGIVIAAGHFSLAMASVPFLYLGLALIICGTGLLKPNVSTMVGTLYEKNDPRRDGGFSIFYMGINLGATISPLVCGYLAQHPSFLEFLKSRGVDPNAGWHFGFAAAGVGMVLGVIQFALGKRHFGPAVDGPRERPPEDQSKLNEPFTREDWTRMAAIAVLFFFTTLFWTGYEQAGSSLNLFADRLTDNRILGREIPSSWYQAINAGFIIAFAPVFAWLWVRLGKREPSSPAKFAWGLFAQATGVLVIAAGALLAVRTGSKVSPMWLVVVYLFSTFGELCLSPVGLSTVTKLAPARVSSLMMGVWFLSLSLGNKCAGWVAGFFDTGGSLPRVFLTLALVMFAAAVALALLTRPIKKLMAGVH